MNKTANTYIYPDGTTGFRRPRDGERFYLKDRVDGSISEWIWDGYAEQWFRKKDGTALSANFKIQYEFEDKEIKLHTNYVKKCECGSEKVGSSRHSTWCAKYSD